MAKILAPEKKDEPGIVDKILNFIQHYKRIIVISLISIASVLVIFIAASIISAKIHEKSLVQIEQLQSDYTVLKNEGLTSAGNEEKISDLIRTLTDFGNKKRGYAAARAFATLGELHAERKEWQEAEEAWKRAADKAPKIYLAPLSLLHSAIAAEEQGKTETALELYNRISAYESSFPLAPRAVFSTGRIQEELKNPDAAILAYQNIVEKWPESSWAKYSQSRIISINASKL